VQNAYAALAEESEEEDDDVHTVITQMAALTTQSQWMTVTTKKGRQSIPPGRYDPATGKTVSWNVTASEVNVATETEALVVKDTGYMTCSMLWT
jgi:carbonic anhydrase